MKNPQTRENSNVVRLSPKALCLAPHVTYLLVILSFALLPFLAYGADVADLLLHFQPYISFSETYDSNVDLIPKNERDDFITTIAVGLKYTTRKRSERTLAFRPPFSTEEERYGVDLDFAALPTFYAKKTSDNYLGLSGNLDSWYTWERNLTFRVNDYLFRSQEPIEKEYAIGALPGQIVLGSQQGRATYIRNVFRPSVQYQFGRENTVSLNYVNNVYRNDNERFEDSTQNYINPQIAYRFDIRNRVLLEYGLDLNKFDQSPDYTSHLGRGRYTHQFNPRTSVFGEYSFQTLKYDSEGNDESVDYDIHNTSIGIDHAFSRTFSITAQLGYFQQLPKSGSGEDGGTYSLVLTQRAQRTTYTLGLQGGYTQDYNSAQNLGFATYHQVLGTISHQLTRKATVAFSGRYQRPEYNDGRTDSLWGLTGVITYQFLRWLGAGFDLTYQENNSNGNVDDYKDLRGTLRVSASY